MPRNALDDDALDSALRRLHAAAPEFRGGLSNHGPMAVEALDALGHPERIAGFVERYATRLEDRVDAPPLPDWTSALGDPTATAAIAASLRARLDARSMDAFVAETVDVLAPGVVAAAFHGPLRAAHAYRSLSRRDSPARRDELVEGLAYWAARYQTLPGEPGRHAQPGHDAASVLASLPILPEAERLDGLILDRFGPLRTLPGFVDAIERFDPHARRPRETLDALVAACARLYLGTQRARSRFVYLHGVTGTAAVRRLLPALSDAARSRLVAYHVQAIAAVHATHAEDGDALSRRWTAPAIEPKQIAALAAQSSDDHTIKLVEACLDEHARGGPPELLVAAAQRVGQID